jgi:hypothetical protein
MLRFNRGGDGDTPLRMPFHVDARGRSVDKTYLYSPNQVGAGSFVGGPFAVVYLLWANFRALGEAGRARATFFWGAIFVVVIFLIVPFLPEKFPNMVIPVAYTVVARLVADRHQMSKQAIAASGRHEFQSSWKVLGLSIALLAAFFAVIMIWLLALDYFHVITL